MVKSGPAWPLPVPPLSSSRGVAAPRPWAASSAASASSAPCVPAAQADLALAAVDAQDLDLDLVADFDDLFGVVDLVVGQLRDVQQALRAPAPARRRRRSW